MTGFYCQHDRPYLTESEARNCNKHLCYHPVQVNGHWYIDGIYGYGYDQRICTDHPSGNGTCLGIKETEDG